ncbi:MAG: site-specific integrase [Clostridia bacterium]|jgi:integrase|nr:site-specific integrase [Clostridia bacterium]
MRLPNGYGSAYKLSGNKRRNPYAARITAGYNNEGQPIYKFIGYYPKKELALQALSDYNKNPYDLDLAGVTVADMWEEFKKRRFNKISRSGINVYTAAYKHLKPIYSIAMQSLKTYQMQKIIDGMTCKWQSKSHVQTLLNQLFEIAMELDICQKNYAKYVDIGSKEQSNIHKAFTDKEIQMLFENVFYEPYADTVLILIYSGMRPSEMLGIKVENVHISEKYIIAGMKTKAGKDRVIPINNKVLPFIKKRYNTKNKYLITESSSKMTYNKYAEHFKKLMKNLNMDHLPHDGRHTFASLMDTAGANKTATKKIMGHATSDITEGVYTHKGITELLYNINLI